MGKPMQWKPHKYDVSSFIYYILNSSNGYYRSLFLSFSLFLSLSLSLYLSLFFSPFLSLYHHFFLFSSFLSVSLFEVGVGRTPPWIRRWSIYLEFNIFIVYFICVVVYNTSWIYEQHNECLIRDRNCLPFAITNNPTKQQNTWLHTENIEQSST